MFALGLTHLTIGKNAHHFVKMCPIKSKLFQLELAGIVHHDKRLQHAPAE